MRQTDQFIAKEIPLPFKVRRPVLAFGAQVKNTLCFIRGGSAYLSPVYADLSNPQDLARFEDGVKYFLKQGPKIIAYDLHPEYQSTKSALSCRLSAVSFQPVQHHHAHIAACMADNGLKNQKVIGVAFDGTGLGDDRRIWGAEFLLCDYQSYRRAAYLREVPLPGGEKAILEPWRVAAAWLCLAYGDNLWKLKADFIQGWDKRKWRVLKNMYLAGYNTPLASSMGRFFDAAGCVILAKNKARFEAELALGLEKSALSYQLSAVSYKFNTAREKDKFILDPLPVLKGIIGDLRRGVPQEKIAFKFHLTAAEMIRKTSLALRKKHRLNRVVLSGGVFQNKLLLRLSLDLLYKEGFKLVIAKNISCNDSGISLGEAVIAGNSLKLSRSPS